MERVTKMKMKLFITTVIACACLMMQPAALLAQDEPSVDEPSYEETMSGEEDFIGYDSNMLMDSENSGSDAEGEPSDEYNDPEMPSEN